jgi:hypothetical protein
MGALLDNPVTSVQLQLRGGWKTILVTTGVYALIVFGAMGLWAELDPKHIKETAEGWTIFLMLAQVGLVWIFSIVRVLGSVRQDNASGIMESHRLMPITGLTACTGFIVGPIGQMLALGLVTCMAGAVSSSVAGLNTQRWMLANAIMFAFLLFSCMCTVLTGFYRRALFNVFVIVILVGLFSQGLLLFATPAMAVLISPLARETVFSVSGSGALLNPGIGFAFFGQAMIGGLMLAAAARKFRQPERHAFTVSLSILLLGAWVALNLVGALQWDAFEPAFLHYAFRNPDDRLQVQFAGSVISAILISLLPMSAAIRKYRERTQSDSETTLPAQPSAAHEQISSTASGNGMTAALPIGRPQRAGHFRFGGVVAAVWGCCWIVCALLFVLAADNDLSRAHWQTISVTAFTIIAAIVNLAAVMMTVRSNARQTAIIVVLFIAATWLVPLFTDVIDHAVIMDNFDSNHAPWSLTAFGPIGTILAPWNPETQTRAGIYCQIGVLMATVSIALAVARRRARRGSATA